MSFGANLKKYRLEKGLTQAALGKAIGRSGQVISNWERGYQTSVEPKELDELAKTLGVDTDKLVSSPFAGQQKGVFLTFADQIQKKIPRIGNIACGTPILAEENIEGFEYLTGGIDADFALTVRGESMAPDGLHDGFVVFIKQMDDVEDGDDIAAVLVDGEATLKRIYRSNDAVTLVASNPQFPPLIYRNGDGNSIRILGKAVGYQGKL